MYLARSLCTRAFFKVTDFVYVAGDHARNNEEDLRLWSKICDSDTCSLDWIGLIRAFLDGEEEGSIDETVRLRN